jgi:hypothetical protein
VPPAKPPSPDRHPSPRRLAGSAEIAAVVDRTAPAVLDLLGDGVPRSRAAVVAALAGRHAKEDVVRTLMRLAVTGRVVEAGGRYAPAAAADPGPDAG